MNKIFSLLFFLAISLTSLGQSFDKVQINGTWKVKSIIEKPTSPQFKPLIEGFKNASFDFNESGDFKLSTSSPSELFGMITQMTNGTKWLFEQNKQFIKIGNKDDGYSIMGISLRQTSGKKLFHLDESGMTLEMEKIK